MIVRSIYYISCFDDFTIPIAVWVTIVILNNKDARRWNINIDSLAFLKEKKIVSDLVHLLSPFLKDYRLNLIFFNN